MLKNYLEKNVYFNCERCYVRGSVALGIEEKKSDIDLLVISDDFQGITYAKRKELVCKTLLKLKSVIDAICLTNSEWLLIEKQHRERFFCEYMEEKDL